MLNDRLIKGNILSCNGTLLKKEIALENKFKEDRALAGSEDWLLWLILSSKYDFVGFSEVTSTLVQHDGRSMAQMDGDKTLARLTLLQEYLEKAVSFQDKYGTEMPAVCGSGELLVALDFALEKKKMSSLKYLFRSIAHDRKLILSRRVLAVVKHLILRW